jgi:formate dehydrogenase maturation protein FdhE
MRLFSAALPRPTPLTRQVTAVRQAMALFVQDDLARGLSPLLNYFCHACERARPALGFIHHGRYQLCNACATEYEVARLCHVVDSVGQFVRDKRFGEAERYALPAEA